MIYYKNYVQPMVSIIATVINFSDNLLEFDQFIEDCTIPPNEEGISKSGDWIVDILAEAQIKTSTYEAFVTNLREAVHIYEGTHFSILNA
jgi:hypothetical protein